MNTDRQVILQESRLFLPFSKLLSVLYSTSASSYNRHLNWRWLHIKAPACCSAAKKKTQSGYRPPVSGPRADSAPQRTSVATASTTTIERIFVNVVLKLSPFYVILRHSSLRAELWVRSNWTECVSFLGVTTGSISQNDSSPSQQQHKIMLL